MRADSPQASASSNPHEYVLGEMFSGPGGIALGAKAASVAHAAEGATIRHGWAVDYHPDTVATYARNICSGDKSTIWTADVRDFNLLQVPAFNAFAFGFPCNDFSAVGERKGLDGDYGALYTYGVHALALHSPEWFIAENVSGLSGANKGTAFGRILEALRHPGRAAMTDSAFRNRYKVVLGQVDENLEYELVAHLYRFEHYGLPQRRHRIMITGIRRDIRDKLAGPFRVPRATTLEPRQQTTAHDVLVKQGEIPPGAHNHEMPRHPQRVKDRLKAIQPGKSAFNTSFTGENAHLRLNVKGVTLSNIYRRLDPNAPAYTVTGSGGGGTHMYHWNEPRALTNRERARLQTFPDSFEFEGGRPSVRRQIGMAVPPDGARIVFSALLQTLTGTEYEAEPNGPNIDVDALIAQYRRASNVIPLSIQTSSDREPATEPATEPAPVASAQSLTASDGRQRA